jgi:hypothetical protein
MDEFERTAAEKSPGLFRELLGYLRHSRKWWIAPILAALILVGFFVMVSGSVLAPFIYALF